MKLSRIIAVIGLLTAFSCSEEWAEEPVQATKSYTLSVTAGKGGTMLKTWPVVSGF